MTGAWPGEDTAYRVAALSVPSRFGETLQRKADHFETLLGILKALAHTPDGVVSDPPFWRQRADAAIAKAEAIPAGARDPKIAGRRAMSEYIVKIGFWLRAYDDFSVSTPRIPEGVIDQKSAPQFSSSQAVI